MIQIIKGKDGETLDELAAAHWLVVNRPLKKGTGFAAGSLGKRLDDLRAAYIANKEKNKAAFVDALLDEKSALLHELVTAPVSAFPKLINRATKLLSRLGLEGDKAFSDELLAVFNYKNWRSAKAMAWFTKLGIDICPYCNLSQIQNNDLREILSSSVDHFYDKASYPYLSLSFYNLIPTCHTCNSTYKNTASFSIDTHLHPYADNYNREALFASDYVEGIADHCITINYFSIAGSRAEKISEDLSLVVRYNHNDLKKIPAQLVALGKAYDTTKINSLLAIGLTVPEVEEQICVAGRIPFTESGILNATNGKLIRDLAIQNKLIMDKAS